MFGFGLELISIEQKSSAQVSCSRQQQKTIAALGATSLNQSINYCVHVMSLMG